MVPFKSGECYHPTTKGPCEEDEWLVVKDSELLVCEKNPCTKPDQVYFNGKCENIYADAVCGKTALGQRLFVNERGEGVCGCDDGWWEDEEGICRQEFTRGGCEENKIIRIRNEASIPKTFISAEEFENIKLQFSNNDLGMKIKCEDNPCGDPRVSLPHM